MKKQKAKTKKAKDKGDKKLWGGRFKKKIDKQFYRFQKSIHYDYKLAEYDIYHSLIHVSALGGSGLLTREEEKKLLKALREVLDEIKKQGFKPHLKSEDIHTDIHNRVGKKVGKLALKLHSLRSRNDQIVFDEKMYCLKEYSDILRLLSGFLEELSNKHKNYEKDFFVGYTHTRRAQVIYFSDYLLAYAQMFTRDYERLVNFQDSLKITLGAGALAGTPLDSKYYQRAVSIAGLVKKHLGELTSPLDNVSDRDFIVEFLSILSILQMHLSRMAEDFILYSTKEFDYLDLPEEFCTGSSLMPHKKNPDFLELVRGYTGKLYGNLVAVLTMMKGLPLSYNRDMQLDKEPLFSSVETIKEELRIMVRFMRGLKLKKDNINRALKDEGLYATELADFLVFKDVAFKNAHDIVGKLIRYSEDKKISIKEMSEKTLKSFHKELNQKQIKRIMNPEYAVSSKRSIFGRSPKFK